MDDDTSDFTADPHPSAHVSVWMNVPADVVYRLASDVGQMPRWAAGLADPALGDADVRFVPANEYGVLDHVVRLPSGKEFYNPMRVVPERVGADRCEVVFTVRRAPEATDDEFAADVAAVTADLETLKRLAEGASGSTG
jgi:hypothetical protein